MAWLELREDVQMHNEIFNASGRHIIFKHSPRCGISSMILRRIEQSDYFKSSKDSFWILDVLSSRNISTQIANDVNVRHVSPQVLLIVDGKLLHHSSHSNIDADLILKIT